MCMHIIFIKAVDYHINNDNDDKTVDVENAVKSDNADVT